MQLETFHQKLPIEIQNLPVSTASTAVYLLLGTFPSEAISNQNTISLIGAIAQSYETTIDDLARSQLSRESLPESSWFVIESEKRWSQEL